jgi:curved DNA-binding protein CbpA
MAARDPYEVLGLGRDASDAQVRATYRHLVQLHHPDHNNGSAESTRRFEEIQDAYARLRRGRAAGATPRGAGDSPSGASSPPNVDYDADLEARLAKLERQARKAAAARERARRAARAAQATGRPTDEELGYITTDDSFSKILADARSELGAQFEETRERPAARRIGELIDELAAKLTRGRAPRSDR